MSGGGYGGYGGYGGGVVGGGGYGGYGGVCVGMRESGGGGHTSSRGGAPRCVKQRSLAPSTHHWPDRAFVDVSHEVNKPSHFEQNTSTQYCTSAAQVGEATVAPQPPLCWL